MTPDDFKTEVERRAFVEGMIHAHGVVFDRLHDSAFAEKPQLGADHRAALRIAKELSVLRERWRLPS